MILKRFLFSIKKDANIVELNDVNWVEKWAFSRDNTVDFLKCDNNLKIVEKSAFEDCYNLQIVEFGSNKYIKTSNREQAGENNIGKYISDEQIKETVSDSLTIQTKAFYNCSKLHTVIFPDIKAGRGKGKLSIEKDAFTGCASLRTVVFGSGKVEIHDQSFIGCNNVSFICPKASDAEKFAREHGIKIINV